MEIKVNHASIILREEKTIYFDPYNIKKEYHDADYIFITHDHYDHYSIEDINKVKNDNTKIIVPKCLSNVENNLVVETNKEYKIDDISFYTIPSYNINKPFHLRNKEYVGYNILLEDEYYYIMGDTDRTPEADEVKTDICFVPIGGTYTMNVDEASEYINYIKPHKVIPIHYGSIVGDISLGEEFKNKINSEIETEIKIGEDD